MSDPLDFGAIKAWVSPLTVISPRIWGFWMAFPLFGERGVPALVRSGLTVAVALFAWPHVSAHMPKPMPSVTEWFLIGPKELLIGFMIGFSLGIVIWALESAGTLVDAQSGTSNAAIMDPLSGAQVGPTGHLARVYAIALMLTSGVFTEFVLALVESFVAWPWYELWPSGKFFTEALVINRTQAFWTTTLRFVAPIMMALILVELGLGLINRATPQFDAYQIGMPTKTLAAAFALGVTVSLWAQTLETALRGDLRLLRSFFG
jgi:type III secretion protein T